MTESQTIKIAGDGDTIIRADGLQKTFGDTVAVRGLSFSVASGKVLGLLGPNGAGKTTTINMLTTLIPPDAGTASIAGFDLRTEARAVRQMIGLAGQTAAVDEKLTARENLRLFGRFYKIPKTELAARIEELITNFRMGSFADRPAGTYSGGERRRLDVVAALVADPPALFLDEPTTGLDPRSRHELWDAISRLASDGTAIVLTTQYLEEADKLADEIVLIDQGETVASGTPEQLKRSLEQEVLEIHLEPGDEFQRGLKIVGDRPGLVLDSDAGLIHIPVVGGAASSLAVLRRLDDAGVALLDFQLRSPTLDDVFMALTTERASGETDRGATT
ncbi:MAG: ATP-binding cassette domain-containing protein [Actinomycetota bacterium]|nr:ATP-binding cassette domain-containing protein [Actinomycetota bacterium]